MVRTANQALEVTFKLCHEKEPMFGFDIQSIQDEREIRGNSTTLVFPDNAATLVTCMDALMPRTQDA